MDKIKIFVWVGLIYSAINFFGIWALHSRWDLDYVIFFFLFSMIEMYIKDKPSGEKKNEN